MTAIRVRLAQRPVAFVSQIRCDAPGCHDYCESRYGAGEARRYGREAGWLVNVRTYVGKPRDYCPDHHD